jgi:hypothetical protein
MLISVYVNEAGGDAGEPAAFEEWLADQSRSGKQVKTSDAL